MEDAFKFLAKTSFQNQANKCQQILSAAYNYFTDIYKLKIENGGRKFVSFFLFQLEKRTENF